MSNMQIVIISGRSGSGKTTALHVLEDVGFYCVDNLPVRLMVELVRELSERKDNEITRIAIGIDARNAPEQLDVFCDTVSALRTLGADLRIIYLDADDTTLLQRFSETRRKHPISNSKTSLSEAIEHESLLLKPVATRADIHIDTSRMTLHELRDLVKKHVGSDADFMTILIESFGFKNGIPADADMVFDVRCLPNPHWVPGLRVKTGLDTEIHEFLGKDEHVQRMISDITDFLDRWLPRFSANNRSYMTVAIGCTGGQHRSVYITERIREHLVPRQAQVLARHRDL